MGVVRAALAVPLRLLLWALLVVVLPQVWLLGCIHGLLCALKPTVPQVALEVTRAALTDQTLRDLFTAHEEALREGKRQWH